MPFFPDVSIFDRSSDEWFNLLYDDRSMCSTPAPLGYSISLATAHLFAAPIYFIAFYSLYKEKTASFRGYKKLLAFHTTSNLLFEFYISVVMRPVVYLPYIVTRFVGVSKLKFVNGGIILYIFVFLASSTGMSIVELFYYRLKLIADADWESNWVKSITKKLTFSRYLLIVGVSTANIFLWMTASGLFEQEAHKEKLEIAKTYPEIMCASSLTLSLGGSSGIKPIHLFMVFAFGSTFYGAIVFSIMGLTCFYALKSLIIHTRASAKTISMHKMFLFSLYAQVGVHVVMLVIPAAMYLIAYFFQFYGNEAGYAALVITSLHGTMATLAMIIFNRPLRIIVETSIRSAFRSTNVVFNNVSFVSMLNQERSN